jgi:ribosomal protein L40E
VGPDLTEMPHTTACPSCGAALRPGAPWCTLCYTDLRPKVEPEPVPVAAEPSLPVTAPVGAAFGIPAADPLTQPLTDFLPVQPSEEAAPAVEPTSAATWPCTTCAAANPISEDSCSVCGQPFLAAMKVLDKPLLVLPVVGDIGAMSRGGRIGLAMALVAMLLVPLALITLLLTGRPPKDSTPVPVAPGVTQVTPAQ